MSPGPSEIFIRELERVSPNDRVNRLKNRVIPNTIPYHSNVIKKRLNGRVPCELHLLLQHQINHQIHIQSLESPGHLPKTNLNQIPIPHPNPQTAPLQTDNPPPRHSPPPHRKIKITHLPPLKNQENQTETSPNPLQLQHLHPQTRPQTHFQQTLPLFLP